MTSGDVGDEQNPSPVAQDDDGKHFPITPAVLPPNSNSFVYPVRSLLIGLQPPPDRAATSPSRTLFSLPMEKDACSPLGQDSGSRRPRSQVQDAVSPQPQPSAKDSYFPLVPPSSNMELIHMPSRPISSPPPELSDPHSGEETTLFVLQDHPEDHTRRSPTLSSANAAALINAYAQSRKAASSQGSSSSEYLNLSESGIVHLPPRPSPTHSADGASRGGSSHGSKESRVSRYNVHNNQSESLLGSRRSSQVSMVESVNSGDSDASSEPLVTRQYEHVEDENGFHVVTGRGGKLARCEDEPIHAPGAVQGFGVLIALEDEEETGNLVVRQVSENAYELLGLSPKYLFSLECFTQTLPDSQADLLWDNVQFIQESELESDDGTPDHSPQVFLLSGWGEPGSALDSEEEGEVATIDRRYWTCWCATHRPPLSKRQSSQSGSSDKSSSTGYQHTLIVIELELERDIYNPLYPPFPREVFHSGASSPATSLTPGSEMSSAGRTPDGSDSTIGSTVTKSSNSGNATTTPTNAAGTSAVIVNSGAASGTSGKDVGNVEAFLSAQQAEGGWFPTPEDVFESTTSHSKPLKALERMRRVSRSMSERSSQPAPTARERARARRGAGQAGIGTMDIFAVLAQVNDQLASANDLDSFLKVVAGVIKDLTQFHRVLILQFDDMWNGQAVAELVDWRQSHELYKGLHFPASDIPAQARDLYKISKVRLLYDRSQTTARLVVRSKEDLDYPLDMTHSYLRAMSPIHVKYLGNMGVRSSMSISIITFGALWGLINCHSYGLHGMRVSFPVRQMLRLLGDSISRNVERLSYAKRLHTRKLISTLPTDAHPTGYIVSNAEDLLGLFDADFGVLVIGEGAKILGPNERGQEILLIAEYLRLKEFSLIQMSHSLKEDYPDLQLAGGHDSIAGLLYVPLSQAGRDFICFLRKGQLREVHWAGRPHKDDVEYGHILEPRKSFKVWSESIAGRSRAWTDEQMETAGVLALVYGKFIEVWRQKESALQTTQLTNILLSNASHEVRTPLNHIINYLEMALNGPLDNETRENLNRSHTASKSLLFTINDLLDLTKLESGKETSFNEPFDLQVAIQEAVNLYKNEAIRRNLTFELDIQKCPRMVIGDSKKIRTVVANLTANAVKYTTEGIITVSCHKFKEPRGLRDPSQVAVEIVVGDTGCGIDSAKLESIFREFEQVESNVPKSDNLPGLGLGLAVVARIVEQLGGQLRVDSKPQEGSRFSFLIPFALSSDGSDRSFSPNSLKSSLRTRSSGGSGGSNVSEIQDLVEALTGGQVRQPSLKSGSSVASLQAIPQHPPTDGKYEIAGSKYPIRSVRVESNDVEVPAVHDIPAGSRTTPTTQVSPKRMASTSSKPPLGSPNHLRVLIVEDDMINRNVLSKRLTNDGHVVVGTTNGQEGVEMVERDRDFDCILMDIQMPILNGFEATRAIRSLEHSIADEPRDGSARLSKQLNGRIPIFAVSASLLEKQRDDMISLGMDGWILKPIDFKRLKTILKGIVDPAQRERDVYRKGCSWEAGGWLDDVRPTQPVSDSSMR